MAQFTQHIAIIAVVAFLYIVNVGNALKEGECEVCVSVMKKFSDELEDDVRKDHKKIETSFRKFCKGAKGKENRLCYYLGGLEESATGILGEMSKPLSWNKPADKICESLKKKDSQICELRYEKTIDFKTVDLKKLKVRDLKKILNDWDEDCDGCIEKSDFIKRIEELKPKYVRDEL